MAGDATEVNAAMETLRNAIAAYNQQPATAVPAQDPAVPAQDPPPPIDEDPAEVVDCVKLHALIDELVQMKIDNCTGV